MSAIPDERLALVFTCCHPALAADSRSRADAARGRRPHDGRDRARVPRRRARDGAAARPREAEDPRRRDPVPRPSRPPAPGASARRPRRALPRLQRGLRGDGRRRPRACRPLRRGDPARQAARRAHARRAGGARAARAHAAAGLAPRRARRRRRRDRAARGPGPVALGPKRGSTRGCRVLERAVSLRRPGPYQLQAAIAAAHAEEPPGDEIVAALRGARGTAIPRPSSS